MNDGLWGRATIVAADEMYRTSVGLNMFHGCILFTCLGMHDLKTSMCKLAYNIDVDKSYMAFSHSEKNINLGQKGLEDEQDKSENCNENRT